MTHHLAQVNIARLKEPIGHPAIADFANALDAVNAEAEKAPGFVWRLQDDSGNATAIHAFEWDQEDSHGVIVNLSVWESVEALKDFIFNGRHAAIMRKRSRFFHKVDLATTALWWIPAGSLPTTADAEHRLRHLRAHGESREAFSLRFTFPPPTE